jgi:hypothetical protein
MGSFPHGGKESPAVSLKIRAVICWAAGDEMETRKYPVN